MKAKLVIYSILILFFTGINRFVISNNYSGGLYAQDATTSQKNIKKEKRKRMREAAKADMAAFKRHHDIQTKATRKRMKKHLKEAKKNIKNSHR